MSRLLSDLATCHSHPVVRCWDCDAWVVAALWLLGKVAVLECLICRATITADTGEAATSIRPEGTPDA